MEATNFTNRHDVLGPGTHTSPAPCHGHRQANDITNNTINPGPTLREETGAHGFAREPGSSSTSPVHDSSQQATTRAVQATEIGDPDGRIPTAQDTRNQLDGARDELVASQGTSLLATSFRASQGAPRTQVSDTATGAATDDLDGTTQQASSNGGPGRAPNPSTGQKAKASFARIHGAGEVLRGNVAATADSFTGDADRQAEDEVILRKGREEFTHGKFVKDQTSRVEH